MQRRAAVEDDRTSRDRAEVHRWGCGGGNLLVMASPTLARTLLHERPVDELRLMIEPVILGGGKTVVPSDGAMHTLELMDTVTSGTGVHVCTYRPVAGG